MPRFEPPRPDNGAALLALLWLGLLSLLLAGLAARKFARVELA
jgi:hypothetical protein